MNDGFIASRLSRRIRFNWTLAKLQTSRATITGTTPGFVQAQQPLTLPDGIQFICVGGIPTGAGTVPDGLGSGANAIDFDLANGGGGSQIYFQPDGRALDGANRLNDGVIYLAQPGNLYSSRAVTLFGSTGRSKGWTLSNLSGGAGMDPVSDRAPHAYHDRNPASACSKQLSPR